MTIIRRSLPGTPDLRHTLYLLKFASIVGLTIGLALTTSALAERRPVLDQIKVPHNYYFREMYLPLPGNVPASANVRTERACVDARWQGTCVFNAGQPVAAGHRF
jgi:hypothetical protein